MYLFINAIKHLIASWDLRLSRWYQYYGLLEANAIGFGREVPTFRGKHLSIFMVEVSNFYTPENAKSILAALL
jgi:hypothetical protein